MGRFTKFVGKLFGKKTYDPVHNNMVCIKTKKLNDIHFIYF